MATGTQQVSGMLFGITALLSGCDETDQPPSRMASALPVADSLALNGPGGLDIFFSLARPARSLEGQSCIERGLEIRRDGQRIRVPLLYTREAPTLLNDSTARAILWTNCRAVAPYRINLRTGQPVREPGDNPTP
jgi:hypothetical protein